DDLVTGVQTCALPILQLWRHFAEGFAMRPFRSFGASPPGWTPGLRSRVPALRCASGGRRAAPPSYVGRLGDLNRPTVPRRRFAQIGRASCREGEHGVV